MPPGRAFRSLPFGALWARRACFSLRALRASFAPISLGSLRARRACLSFRTLLPCFAFCALLSLRSGWALVPLRSLRPLWPRNALIPFGPLSPGGPRVSRGSLRALRAWNPLIAF